MVLGGAMVFSGAITASHNSENVLTTAQKPLIMVIKWMLFILILKVGSCPNDGNSVQIFLCPFLCSI